MRKPLSERQLAANRANAKKSTGPRTPEGKARSSLNGLTHGLSARRLILPNEDREQFDSFARAMRKDLCPRGPVETLLVEEVIEAAWKLRRADVAEARIVRRVLTRYAGTAARKTPGILLGDAIDGEPRAEALMRVENYALRVQRSFFTALRRLQRARAQREALTSEPTAGAQVSPRESAASPGPRGACAAAPARGPAAPGAQVRRPNPFSTGFSGEN